MTHVELIEKIRDAYKEDFENEPTKDEAVDAFRHGMIFAYNYLIAVLKNGSEWVYENK